MTINTMSEDIISKEAQYIEVVNNGHTVEDGSPRSEFQPQAIRRVILKQDLVILPLLSLSFFFAYLVRLTVLFS